MSFQGEPEWFMYQLNEARELWEFKNEDLRTSTPASSKMAPMVDSEVASSKTLIFSRIKLIA
jgi:hypothetical protein